MSAAGDGGGSRHITYKAPTAGTTPWARPTFAPPLMTDPDTVTTTGRRKAGRAQRSLSNESQINQA
jgi:hypothetical protein